MHVERSGTSDRVSAIRRAFPEKGGGQRLGSVGMVRRTSKRTEESLRYTSVSPGVLGGDSGKKEEPLSAGT